MIRSVKKWLSRSLARKVSVGFALILVMVGCGGAALSGLGATAFFDRGVHSSEPKPSKESSDKNSQKNPHKTLSGVSSTDSPSSTPSPTPTPSAVTPSVKPPESSVKLQPRPESKQAGRTYPLHIGIVSTTFWVGEIFDANAADGSQMLSTYDANWFANYGGCDGIASAGVCKTEKRDASNGFFPSSMTPKQNPFYLDLPYDDVNDPIGFKNRGSVIPWANDPGYAGKVNDRSVSFMKNRWVKLMKGTRTCYGQIADAGPGQYHDASYVFGGNDARPANQRYGGAGMDVSPALNGCLGFTELDGQSDKVDWQFVDAADVPAGPWLKITSNSMVVIN